MRYISVFSGIEAASAAWTPLGWEPVAFSEIEPFPCAVLEHRFPGVPNLGDITEVDWSPYSGSVDVVVGGSPCFPAGTLVLCSDGYRPIELVEAGDMVVTHKGRLRRVLRTGCRVSDTIVLKGQGVDRLECTPEHPFLATDKVRVWDRSARSRKMVPSGEASWVKASDMAGRFWFNVCAADGAAMPRFAPRDAGSRGGGYIDADKFDYSPDFFYFVGRWLGDGWANAHERKNRHDSKMKRVYVCCSHGSADELAARLSRTGLRFSRSEYRTTTRFTCSSTQLHDWLVGNFGVHANGKNVPAWVLALPRALREAILSGYFDSDGCSDGAHMKTSSISKALCLGMKSVAGSLGIATSMTRVENRRSCAIEGRGVGERPYYTQSYWDRPRSAFFGTGGWFGKVRSVLPGRKSVPVFNLEVEDDNSYTAAGIAVHNCQSFSVAGGREGLDGESRLMYEYIRCVQDVSPRWLLWENVPGVLSIDAGRAFGILLHEVAELGYSLAWRVLDAQFFGVAQRRRRVFLVGHLGGGCAPAAVLFEPESVPGNSASSRAKRAELAAGAGRGAKSAGFGDPAATSGSIGYRPEQAQTLKAGSNKASTKCILSVAANQRGEVRLDGTDGQTMDAILATRSGKQIQGVLTPWDVQSKRVYSPVACGPTLPSGTREGVNIQPSVLCMASGQANAEVGEDVGTTLSARQYKDPPITAVTRCGCEGGGKGALTSEDVSLTLSTLNEQALFDPQVGPRYVVRRLTPLECERLQGFEDGWTDIPYRGRDHPPDSPRYKALGNSMAVNVMAWIGRRIELVDGISEGA